VNVALEEPAGTATEAGIVAALLLVFRAMVTAVAAIALRVTVASDELPPTMVEGLSESINPTDGAVVPLPHPPTNSAPRVVVRANEAAFDCLWGRLDCQFFRPKRITCTSGRWTR
jgi:hypothetical protein